MPVIRVVPQDPPDLVIQGEQLRPLAMFSVFSAPGGLDIPATKPAHLDRLASLIEGDQSEMFPPNDLIVPGDQAGIGIQGNKPLGMVDVLASQDNGAQCAAANAVICTPAGAIYPVRLGQHLMDAFTESTVRFQITGVTRNNVGTALAGCRVIALEMGRMAVTGSPVVSETISDGSGIYTLPVPSNGPYQILAYKPGAPDVGGVSLNTLTPAQV